MRRGVFFYLQTAISFIQINFLQELNHLETVPSISARPDSIETSNHWTAHHFIIVDLEIISEKGAGGRRLVGNFTTECLKRPRKIPSK